MDVSPGCRLGGQGGPCVGPRRLKRTPKAEVDTPRGKKVKVPPTRRPGAAQAGIAERGRHDVDAAETFDGDGPVKKAARCCRRNKGLVRTGRARLPPSLLRRLGGSL